MADQCDAETPWYLPLIGENTGFSGLRRGRLGRRLARRVLGILEKIKVVPEGSLQVSQMLGRAAEALIAGGETRIFTPNFFFVARRPR
jgi:sterol 24-C-methyltransferase